MVRETYNKICFGQIPETQQLREDNTTKRNQFKRSTDDVSSQNFSDRNSGFYERSSHLVYESDNYIRRTQNSNNNNNNNTTSQNNNSYNPQATSTATASPSPSSAATATVAVAATVAAASSRAAREQRDCLFGSRNGPFSSANILSERSANSNTNSPIHQQNNRVPPSSSASWYDIATTSTNGPGGSGNVGASVAGGSINSSHNINQHHHYYTNTSNATTAHSSTTSISLTTPPASSTIATASATTTTLASLGSATYQRGNSHDSGLINKRNKINKLYKSSSAGAQSSVESPLPATTESAPTTATLTTSYSNSSCSTISSNNNPNLSSNSNSTTSCSSGIVSNSILNAMTSATVEAVNSTSSNSGHCGETTAAAATATATTANASYASSSSTIPSANASNSNNNNNSNSTTSHSATRVTHARCTTSSSRSHSRSPSSYSSSHSSSSSSHASSHTSSPILGVETSVSSGRGATARNQMQSAVSTPIHGSSNNPSGGGACSSSSSSSSSSGSCPTVTNPVVHSEDNRPLAIRVRNLPGRSSDTSLKDGLFHEYKKHGKVTWVKVVGQNSERYALVCFKKPEDVEKALEVSHDKLFFGCKIEVEPYQGYDVEDNEFRPYEAELDEYHPKSTRTLFIGNLEKDITASELRGHFENFGEIIEIDIKKQGMNAYAFCQYSDIVSVVKAMRKMDGEHLGNNRIKLGFGKSMPTNCVWIDGIGEKISESHLQSQFSRYGTVTKVIVDRVRQLGLVLYEQIQYAQTAVKEMRGTTLRGRRLQVDFASRECQDAFYEKLEKQNTAGRFSRYDSQSRSRASSFSRHQNSNDGCSPSNTPGSSSGSSASCAVPPTLSSAIVTGVSGLSAGNNAIPSTGATGLTSVVGQVTSVLSGGSSTPARSRGIRSMRSHTIDYDFADVRRFRAYDEYSQGSAASHDEDASGGTPVTPLHSTYTSAVGSSGLRSDSPLLSRLGPIVGSAAAPVSANESFEGTLNSGRRRCDKSPGKQKGDIRVLQKERFHLLEQLEECPSSGDENIASPRKRIKTDHHHSSNISSGLDASSIGETHRSNLNSNCDSNQHDPTLHRKGDMRRLSDFGKYHLQPPHQQQQHLIQQHLNRRPSNDLSANISSAAADHNSIRHNSTSSSSSEHYGQHQLHGTTPHLPSSTVPCKRRRVVSGGNCNSSLSSSAIIGAGSSNLSGSHNSMVNDDFHHHASRGRGHPLHSHHSHEASCGESADGSRPGTPLCDERPEVLPTEPRRVPRERPHEPMVLPLPKFGIQFFQQYRNSGGVSTSNATSAYHHHSGNLSSSLTNPHVNYGLSNSHLGGNNSCSSHSSLNHNLTSSSATLGSAHLPSPSSRYPHWRPHHHHHHSQLSSAGGGSSTSSLSASVVSPLRPRSLSSNSSDSDVQAQPSGSPSLEERIRTLDEMYERWSGGSAVSSAAIKRHDFSHGNTPSWQIHREHSSNSSHMPTGTINSLNASMAGPTARHKFLDLDVNELQPSEIVKSVLAKKSLFDDDLQRLKKNQWLEPTPADITLNSSAVSSGLPNLGAASKSPVVGSTNSSTVLSRPGALLQRLSSLSPMNSPQASMSPYNSPSPSPSVSCSFSTPSTIQKQSATTAPPTVPTMPVPTTPTTSSTATKGLQYPFPSHPPLPSTAAPGPVAQPPLPAEQSKLPPMPAEQPPPPIAQGDAHTDLTKQKPNIIKSLSVPMNSSIQVEKPSSSTLPAAEAARMLIKSVSVPGSTNIGTVKILSSTIKSSPEQVPTSGNSSSTTSSTSNKLESDNTKPSKSVTVPTAATANTSSPATSKKNEKSHKHIHRNDSEKKSKHERSSEKRKKSLTSTPRVEEETSDSDNGGKTNDKSSAVLTVVDKEKLDRENLEKEKQQKQQRELERQEREKRERELKRQQEKEEREHKEREEREKRENDERERAAKLEKDRLEREERARIEREECERRTKDENERRQREENDRKQQKAEQERQERERRSKMEKERIGIEERDHTERRNKDDTEKHAIKAEIPKLDKDGLDHHIASGSNVQRLAPSQVLSSTSALDVEKQNNKENTANIETSMENSLTNKHHSVRKSSRSSPIRHPKRRLSSHDNTSGNNASETNNGDENAKRMRIEGQENHGSSNSANSNISAKDKEGHTKDLSHRSSNKHHHHHHHQRQHSSSSHKSEHAVASSGIVGCSNAEKSKNREHSSKYKSKHHNKSSSHGHSLTSFHNQNQLHGVPVNESNSVNESENLDSSSLPKNQPGAESVLAVKLNNQHEDISSDQEQEPGHAHIAKTNSSDDEDLHTSQGHHQNLTKTPSHGSHHTQHRHREHHSSSRHKSKREHRDKKRHSIAESSTGNTMTDEEVGSNNAAHSVHRRISAGGSTTSDTATPTTRESKSKSSDHALSGSHRSDRKLSRCSEDGSNILPNTPTCRMGGNKNTPLRKMIMSSADSDDSEDTAAAKKRSIFDIPDDGPYVSMYDKVKARSCKNMQKQEEEKKIKAKFSQLKQSRAKREEKKRSASYDGDSDSEFDEQMNHRIGGDSGSYRSRNHGGLTSSSDGGGMDDGDDEESIIARRRSSQASSSRRKFSDSDSTTAAEVAEDAARRMRTHENLLRLCDGDDSSDDEIRNNAKRSSPSKRLKATKRSIHAIQRIASDSESQSQPPAIVDIKIKQEIKHLDESTAQSFESGEMEGKIKDTIKKEPHTAPESDIELKLKRRSSISSGDDQQLIPPMNVKMEPGVCSGNMLSTDEIKKEYKAIFDESYELNLPEHKVKEMMQHQTHYSPEGGRKKHKKSKKRQKGNTITMLEGEGSTSLHFTTANALETVSKVISGSALNTTVGIMNATGEQKNSFDVFDELKRQDSVKLEPTTPTVGANNGNSSDFLAVNNNEKKRHKDRKEKKREKLRSIGGSDISTTVCGPLVSPGVDVDKLSKEERHRLKKSKKSKSLELVRASHTPTTSACVNISPYATPTALKRIEGKMEDIFGPISDEESQFSDIVCKEFSPSAMKLGDTCASTPTTSNVIGPIVSAAINPYKQDPLTPKSHTVEENEENILKVCNIGVSATGGSTTGVGSVSVSQSERERQRKEKREKKRREREKSREQHALSALQKQQKHHECLDDENSVDLDEAGRALEAQLMDDSDNKITEDATPSTATTYRSDMTDVFRFSDGDENSVELLQSSATATNKKDGALSHVLDSTLVQNMQQQPSITKLKEKKKKKKRSKDEKHHHQRRESSCSSTASSSHHVQAHVQQTSSATSMMSPPAPNSGVPSIGKLTVDILAATKHSQMLENQTAAVDEDDNIPNLPICKPSPSLPCLIGDDDDDITLCRPKTACKPTITPIVSATTTPQNCTDSLSLSPIREKQMISPIPKTPTTTNTSKEKDKSAPKTPGTPVSTVSIEASALKNSSTSTPLVIKTDDFSTNSLVSSALSPDSIASNLISQKKKPENFIPGFDGELDQKISESAVQSISAELNTPVLDPNVDEPKIPVESPPDASMHLEKIEDSKSRVQISQEETESAVSALLGESFGNSSTADFDAYNDVGCLEDLAEPTVVAGVDEEAAIAARSIEGSLKEPIIQTEEECEEVSMAIQSLSTSVDVNDIKPPDTPQSDRGLQIDTDTEDNNADEADSSGNSLKIDETTRASLTEEVSDKPEKSDLLTESVDTFNKSVVSAASVITKLELTSEPKLTETSSDKTKVKDSKVLKLESEKDTLKSESKSSKVSTAELPSMISLEEPLDTKATKTDCAKEVNTSSNASVAVKTIPPLDNSIHAPTTQRCEVKKHSSEIALPNVHFMQPPTISIPDLPVNFALPQMTISPRSSAAHDRHNLSPRPQPIKTLQSPKATISAANSLQDSTNSGANTSMHHSIPSTTLTVTTKSSQHSASNVSAALSSPGQQGRAQQTQPQQKALNVSQSTSNSTFSISPSTPQLIQLPCTANNNNNNKNNCKSQSPSVDRQTVDVQGALKVAGNSTGVTLLSPTTTRPSQMRVVQPCQMVKSVIEHGSVQHQQQQHGPMSITVQKIPPVTAHPTIISKVVNVQPQKAQQLSSPTRPLHSPIQQQQQQVGHLLPISTVQKTITNPYHQQQQKHEQNYLQPQSQHHILQSRSTPIQKVQQLPQKLQQQQQQQTQQPKPSSLGLSVPNSTSTTVNTSTSGTKTTVVISNQSHPNTSLFRQQQQQQPHQQPISPNMSMGIHQQQQQQQQQANTSISQSIIVQQQIVGRPSQAPEQAQQHLQQKQQQHTSNNINKSATHLGSSTFVPKQVSPSIVIEPLGLVPNVNKEIEKSPTTTSTTLTSTNTFTNVVSMSAVPQITVTPSNVSDKEKLSIPPNKVAENVSVIMNPPTPTSNNRTNSVLSSEVQRSPVLEANTTTSMAVQGTITEVSITTKDEKADHSWPQKPLKDSSGTDSVIKKADKTEDNPSKPIPTSVTATVPTTSSNVITTPATSENTVRAINESNKESVSTESIATSSTDHDTEDETETKQSMTAGATKSSVSMTIPSFEQVALSTNTQITVGKATRGGGAKRGRQPRGGKKQAAGLPTAAPIMATSPTDSDSGIQTRLRKPLTVSTVTRGRKGRPPRNALLTQRALQQQQQEFNQQQQMQQTVHPSNAVPPAKTSILTAAEKKERNQTFNTIPMASSAASTASSDQDVYEFHDESTEELRSGATDGTNEDTRPRLILTIKSPGHASSSSKATEKPLQTAVDPLALPVTSPEPLAQTTATHGQAIASQKHIQDLAVPSQQTQCLQQPTTPGAIHQQQQQPHQQQEDHLHSNTNAVTAASNTRKSRRLQEKDRSTIDDIIEDVVRNTQTPPPALALPKGAQTPPRRSGRNVATNPKKNELPALALPHTPNAVGRPRRSKDRKSSENSVEQSSPNSTEQQSPKQQQTQQASATSPAMPKPKNISTENVSAVPPVDEPSVMPKHQVVPENVSTEVTVTQAQSHSVSPVQYPSSLTITQHHPQHPKKKAIAAAEIESYAAAVAAAAMNNNPSSVSALPPGGLPMLHTAAPSTQKVTGGTADAVNKSLIDPVTGLISGMQQGKEGNLPMATAAIKKMLPSDNVSHHQSHPATDTIRSSPPVIHKLPPCTTATALHVPVHNQMISVPPPSQVCSIATPITALTKPVQTEAAAPATTLTVPASLANKPVSVVVKTSTVPPVVIQQQIVQPTTQQGVATPTKQPIVVQQSQLLMHAQHTNVRPPTLKAHVLNSQKQLQQATLTPIPSPNQPQHSTIVIGGNNTTSIGGTSVPTATSASHHVIQSNIVARHNVQLPPTSTAAVLQHQQLLVNIPTAHSPHGVSTATQALLNSPRVQPQQTLVIKQGGTAIQSQQPSSQATQILHVVTSKANAVTGLPQQQHQTIYSVSQQQHAYMTNSASGIKQQQQQITVLPVEQAQHHVKQQQQQQQQALQHVTLQQKQMQPQSIGVSVVAHQQQNQATTLSSKQSQQQQTLILPAGLQQLNMPPHSNMVLQAKQLPTGMPAHLHAQQLTPSPPATTISKQNPVVHNLQNQSTTPKMSSSPPAALKIQQQLSQQPQTTMLAGTPTNLRTAIPSISPQGQARVTPLLLPTGMPVTIFEANMHDIGKYGGVPSSTRVTQSPPPAHQQASPITPGESAFSTGALRGVPPPREPFMIYQQLLRSQESMNASLRCANEYEEKMLGSSPPLELRRPGSVPRTITVPHSLQSPQDRTSDSPQAAQIYVHNSRIPHPHYPSDVTTSRGFYDAAGRQITIEPPPAHRSAAGSSPFMSTPPAVHPPPPPSTPTAVTAATAAHIHAGNLIEREREREREQQDRLKVTGAVTGHDSMVISAAMSTPTGRNMQVATPTHGSQVPPPQPNADSLLTLLQRYPVMWQGLLALKTDQAAVQMHFVFGNPHVARASLPCNSDGSTPPLRIAQRMRLEQTQLEGVAKKMQFENEHCMLLALPCGRDHADVLQHSRNLQTGFITYLQQKMAAGIVNIPVPGSEQAAYVVHIFPSCDFANENLERAAPDLKNRVAEIAHLLIVIATV